MPRFFLVNASTLIDDPAAMGLISQAVDLQILEDAGPIWGRWGNVFVADGVKSVPPDGVAIVLYDDPDQADALGWHTEALGSVFGRIFVRPVLDAGGDLYSNPALSVSSVVSHEVLETLVDPTCADWSDRGDGVLVASEVCDPVESDSYTIDVLDHPIQVSNFVTPAWFDAQNTSGPFDKLGKLSRPFTRTAGGYFVEMQAGPTQSVGDRKVARALARKSGRASRRARKP